MSRLWYEPSFRIKSPLPEPDEVAATEADPAQSPRRGVCGARVAGVRARTAAPPRLLLRLRVGDRQLEMQLLPTLARGLGVALLWLAAYAALAPANAALVFRGGVVLDAALTLVVCSVVGGTASKLLGVPAIVGILWAGVLFNHVGPEVAYLTGGITRNIRKAAGSFAVSVIVARAGLAISVPKFVAQWKAILCLALVPLTAEALVHAGVAAAVFDLPDFRWAVLQGFTCSAIAPGVIVPGMFVLAAAGFTGPLPLMFSAVVLDAVVGVWAINFFSDLIFAASGSTADLVLGVALGPIQMVLGVLCGVLVGLGFHIAVKVFASEQRQQEQYRCGVAAAAAALAAEELVDVEAPPPAGADGADGAAPAAIAAPPLLDADGNVASLVGVMFTTVSVLVIFGMGIAGFPGGGAIAVAAFAATVSNVWAVPVPTRHGAASAAMHAHKAKLMAFNAWLWDAVAVPFLFSMAGSEIDLTKVFDPAFIGGGAAALFTGAAARFAAAAGVAGASGYNRKEAALVGLAWLGKGAVQMALAGLASSRATGPAQAAAADTIQRAAWLATIVFAPVAALSLVLLGARFLTIEVTRR
jgi:hypothetical protein